MVIPPVTVLPSKLRTALEADKIVAFDLECEPPAGGKPSEAKDARKAVPFLVTVACGRYVGAFDMRNGEGQLILQYLLAQPDLTVIAHNILYDFLVLDAQKIVSVFDVKAVIRDPMVGQFMLDEDKSSPKGLKDMVKRHLKKRMRTYEETVYSNPHAMRMKAIDTEIAFWEKMLAQFPRRRPWPTLDSAKSMKRSDLNQWVKTQMDKQWPGTANTSKPRKKDGTHPRKYTTDEQNRRKAFKAKYDDKIEEAFGLGAQLEFELYVHENYIDPLREERVVCDQALTKLMVRYAKDDARQTLRLWKKLCQLIRHVSNNVKTPEGRPSLWQWFMLECDVRAKSLHMCARGTHIDRNHLYKLKETIDPIVEEFKRDIDNLAKVPGFKPSSPKQLCEVLFKHMNIPIPSYEVDPITEHERPKLTPEGMKWLENNEAVKKRLDLRRPSTVPDILIEKYLAVDNEVLERLSDPIGMAILNYRTMTKLQSTYVDGMLERTEHDPRLRCLFKSIGTDTGRFSSAEPNLQNIPSRWKPDIYDERIRGLGPMLRDAFVAAPGKSLIVADQSQIELRIITHFCREQTMRHIYTDGVNMGGMFFYTGDIHSQTSNQLGIPRKLAKNVNFGFNYGMGPLKFARQIRLFLEGTYEYDLKTAREWKDGFFRTYPGIIVYIDRLKKAWDKGQRNFQMLSGRHRHFHDNGSYVSGGKILNAKVQGSSADLLKINIWIIENFVKPLYPSLELLLQIHDELVYEVDEKYKEECAVLIKYVMEYPWFPLSVPVLASAKHCPTWAAKDDDDRPETGVFYAESNDGERRIWTDDDWHVYREMEDAKEIKVKSACAMLTPDQLNFCKSIIPARLEIPA